MSDTPPAFDLGSLVKPITESARFIKFLVYGDPKVGKTTFAATAPAPLFLTVEPGTIVLQKNEENRRRFADVQTTPLPNVGRLNAIMDALRQGQLPDRKTIVLDSLSEFQSRVLAQWTKHAMANGLSKNNNEFAPEWDEYNSTTSILKKAMWEFRDLERHIVVICHARDDKDSKRGNMQIERPALMPSLGLSLSAMFNVVGYMYMENGIPMMRVVSTPNIVAGNHIWDGPPVVENPTFDMFMLERAMQNDVRS